MIDAAKRTSAKRITVIAPFYPYSRQDKKYQGCEPISVCLMADLYRAAGADRIMSVDPYAPQEQGFFDGPVDHLFAMSVPVDYVCGRVDLANTATASPDAGRIRVTEKWSKELGGASLAFVHKTRDTTRPNVAVVDHVVGEAIDKECVLMDDMVDTAGTITEATNVLNSAGAKRVIVVATYGILSDPAVKRLPESGATEAAVINTLSTPAEKRFEQLTVLSTASLLARAIQEVFEDGSVTSFSN